MGKPEVPVTDLFFLFFSKGLTLEAMASRLRVPLDTLIRAMAGLVDPPQALQREAIIKALFPKGASEQLLVATKGPRGSVRWHEWSVPREVAWKVANCKPDHAEDFLKFETSDNLVVAVNPRHIVTALISGDDTRYQLEQKAFVPQQTVWGLNYMDDALDAMRESFTSFVHAAKGYLELKESEDEAAEDAYVEAFAELGQRDVRPAQAWLLDLKNPFVDLFSRSSVSCGESNGRDRIATLLEDQGHLLESSLDEAVCIADEDGDEAWVLLREDQVTVLQCTIYDEYRFRLEGYLRMLEEDESFYLKPETIEKEMKEAGIFAPTEVAEYVERFTELVRDRTPPKERLELVEAGKPKVRGKRGKKSLQ